MTGERKLWIDVLLRGLADPHAQEWRANQDFKTCCDLAGMESEMMRLVEPARAAYVLRKIWPHLDTGD